MVRNMLKASVSVVVLAGFLGTAHFAVAVGHEEEERITGSSSKARQGACSNSRQENEEEVTQVQAPINGQSLPDELLLHVYEFLGVRDLVSARRVCQLWDNLITNSTDVGKCIRFIKGSDEEVVLDAVADVAPFFLNDKNFGSIARDPLTFFLLAPRLTQKVKASQEVQATLRVIFDTQSGILFNTFVNDAQDPANHSRLRRGLAALRLLADAGDEEFAQTLHTLLELFYSSYSQQAEEKQGSLLRHFWCAYSEESEYWRLHGAERLWDGADAADTSSLHRFLKIFYGKFPELDRFSLHHSLASAPRLLDQFAYFYSTKEGKRKTLSMLESFQPKDKDIEATFRFVSRRAEYMEPEEAIKVLEPFLQGATETSVQEKALIKYCFYVFQTPYDAERFQKAEAYLDTFLSGGREEKTTNNNNGLARVHELIEQKEHQKRLTLASFYKACFGFYTGQEESEILKSFQEDDCLNMAISSGGVVAISDGVVPLLQALRQKSFNILHNETKSTVRDILHTFFCTLLYFDSLKNNNLGGKKILGRVKEDLQKHHDLLRDIFAANEDPSQKYQWVFDFLGISREDKGKEKVDS